jgi:hypothetical protein
MMLIAIGIVAGKQDGAAGKSRDLLNLRLAEKRGLILGVFSQILVRY